jgi:hypothetical protein
MPAPMIEDVITFLTTHRQDVLNPDLAKSAWDARFSGRGVLTEIVRHITTLDKTRSYGLLRLPSKTAGLNEAIDMTFLPIDLMQMSALAPATAKSLAILPDLNNKLIINITDLVKANGGSDIINFSDITLFYNRVVRDFLSRSYYTSTANAWMSPAFVSYVAKVYSMTIGGQLAKALRLSPLTRSFIQTVFAAFYVTKMTSVEVAPLFLKANARNLDMPAGPDLAQILALMMDVLGKATPESIEDVCKVIHEYDHSQLSVRGVPLINRPMLNKLASSLFSESHTAVIALEYPPYFAYLILMVLSQIPIRLAYPMKNLNLLPAGKEVMDQLVKSPSFLQGL